MTHMAYPMSQSLASGGRVTIIGTPVKLGDILIVEYPNNERAEAEVVKCSANILEIAIGDSKWRLAPLNPAETLPSVPPDSMASIVWVIQPS